MRSPRVALLLVQLLGTAACTRTTVFSGAEGSGAIPVIGAFRASPAVVKPGGATQLSWSIANARKVTISPGLGDVTGKTSVAVQPSATTTYTVEAANDVGWATFPVTVEVRADGSTALPEFTSATATPATASAGDPVTLAWTVSNATGVSIDQGVGDVTGRSTVVVKPTVTTTYTITATNAVGYAAYKLAVTVGTAAPPVIASFAATPDQITAGGSSTLAWQVSGATSVSIDGGVGDVTASTGAKAPVWPGRTTTYTLTATGPGGTRTAQATVTVTPADAPPAIASFTATPDHLTAGGSSTLAWSVTGTTTLAIAPGVGAVTGTSVAVTPATTTTYTLTATGAGGTKTAQVTVTVTAPSTADATLTVDTSRDRKPISPHVYGYNAATAADAAPGATYLRVGGNRWTAYNWASNHSNAGADWGPYSSDTHMGSPADGPGHAATPTIDDAKTKGLVALVTIPNQGWVAKDGSGNVSLTSALADRFVPNKPRKGSAFTTTPSATSAEVYQDEFASFVAQRWGAGHEVHLSVDNEPDLWGYVSGGAGKGTHPEVQRTQLGYADFLARWVESAAAIKDAVPGALLYGPVSYGWMGYVSFQSAPDAPATASIDDSFLDYFLGKVAAASASQGRRLLDAFDLHFYSEAKSTGCANAADDGVKIQAGDYDKGAADWVKRNLDCVVAARVQAPRSLYDLGYVESSWVTQWSTKDSTFSKGIALVPRMLAKIAARYPGTRLSLSEYNHGGADHVSGALAQADALGILGREGVWAAAYWPITTDVTWIHAAFRSFRNFDGAGKAFGDTSVKATSSDDEHLGVYASVDAANADRVVIVIVHRPTLASGALDLKARTVKLQWTHPRALTTARAWQLTAASTTPASVTAPTPSGSALTLTVPAESVTTLELTP